MSKEPAVRHKYHAKKDRLEITIKHYVLKRKADREKLIGHLLRQLEKSPALAKANAKKRAQKNLPKNPTKESKLVQVGD
jgi:hypothetical protein